jgi:hypothetical protein
VTGDQIGEFGDQFRVPAQPQIRVDPPLDGHQPGLLQPRDLDLQDRTEPHVHQRGPLPQGQSLP